MSKKKLAVIGVGSAGIQSLCHFLAHLDSSWEVYSIHDPSKEILGIGESSNPSFISALEAGLGFNIVEDLEELNGTLKFGTKYTNWREHEFVNPLLSGTVAIHFDTYSLYNFAMKRLNDRWQEKFKVIEGNVSDIENNNDHVKLTIEKEIHIFDYVIDCSGTPDNFDEYNMIDPPLLTKCLVHNTHPDSTTETEYTGHIATKDGWMFRVPLMTRTSYGYLFNSRFTDENEAKKNFADIIGVDVKNLQNTSFSFNPYHTKNIVDGRIIKNGNAAFFFEPMFANSLWVYNLVNKNAWDFIHGNINHDEFNSNFETVCSQVLSMISFHYLGGSTYSTKFWKKSTLWSENNINNIPTFKKHLEELDKKIKTNSDWISYPPWVFDPQSLKTISNNLGYDYI